LVFAYRRECFSRRGTPAPVSRRHIGNEHGHWSDTPLFPPVCAAVPRACLSARLLVYHSPDLSRQRVAGASSRGTFLRDRDQATTAREGMYAAVRSPTFLPIPTAVHGQWRVPGSNAPAAGTRKTPFPYLRIPPSPLQPHKLKRRCSSLGVFNSKHKWTKAPNRIEFARHCP
jgi:hypothetical protein